MAKGASKKQDASGVVLVASNRAARHNFAIDDTYECGIVLRGSEVKSLRESKVQLSDAFGQISGGELYLHHLHIAPYSMSQRHSGHDPMRVRKLLLHRHELDRMAAKVQRERLTPALTVELGTSLAELIGIASGRSEPIAVVDPGGRLRGVVVKGAILAALASETPGVTAGGAGVRDAS